MTDNRLYLCECCRPVVPSIHADVDHVADPLLLAVGVAVKEYLTFDPLGAAFKKAIGLTPGVGLKAGIGVVADPARPISDVNEALGHHEVKPETCHEAGTLVVVSEDEELPAIHATNSVDEALLVSEETVPEPEHGVVRPDDLVVVSDEDFPHLVHVAERSFAVLDDVRMAEVEVRCKRLY